MYVCVDARARELQIRSHSSSNRERALEKLNIMLGKIYQNRINIFSLAPACSLSLTLYALIYIKMNVY